MNAIEAIGGQAFMLQLDAENSEMFSAFSELLAEELASRFNRNNFDFLVNNAGVDDKVPFMETTEAQFEQMFRVHLKAPFSLSQTLVPMITDNGRILNVSLD